VLLIKRTFRKPGAARDTVRFMAPPAPHDFSTAAERLYGVTPEEFVQTRDELSRSLREAGEQEAAERMRALRKPTLPVWVVNQLARSNRREVRQLLRNADRLRRAHGASPAKFQEALKEERDALEALRKPASELLTRSGHGASETILSRVVSTLQGAASRPETVDALASGTLEQEVEPPGFEALAGMSLPPQRSQAQRASSGRRQPERASVRGELTEARGKARELDRAAAAAEREAAVLRARADRANEDVARLEKKLKDL
jgi:hypothetical protein